MAAASGPPSAAVRHSRACSSGSATLAQHPQHSPTQAAAASTLSWPLPPQPFPAAGRTPQPPSPCTPLQERPEWLGPKLAKVVEDINWGLDALTASPVLGVDAAGRDIVKLAAMPKTAVVHAEVSTPGNRASRQPLPWERGQQCLAARATCRVRHACCARRPGPGAPAMGCRLPECCCAPLSSALLRKEHRQTGCDLPAAGPGFCAAEEEGGHPGGDPGASGAHQAHRAARRHSRVVGPRLPARQELQPGPDGGWVPGGGGRGVGAGRGGGARVGVRCRGALPPGCQALDRG